MGQAWALPGAAGGAGVDVPEKAPFGCPFERGRWTEVDPERLLAIADTLNASSDWLLGRLGERKNSDAERSPRRQEHPMPFDWDPDRAAENLWSGGMSF